MRASMAGGLCHGHAIYQVSLPEASRLVQSQSLMMKYTLLVTSGGRQVSILEASQLVPSQVFDGEIHSIGDR
jgi:hypothetical protein